MFIHLQRVEYKRGYVQTASFVSNAVHSPTWASASNTLVCGLSDSCRTFLMNIATQFSFAILFLTSLPTPSTWNPTAHHTHPTLRLKSTNYPQQPFVLHTTMQRVLNLYLENVNGITHGESYNFIISRSFCSFHRFHEGPSALMALGERKKVKYQIWKFHVRNHFKILAIGE